MVLVDLKYFNNILVKFKYMIIKYLVIVYEFLNTVEIRRFLIHFPSHGFGIKKIKSNKLDREIIY